MTGILHSGPVRVDMNDERPSRAFTLSDGYFFDTPERGPISLDLEQRARDTLGNVASLSTRGIWLTCMPLGTYAFELPEVGWKVHLSIHPKALEFALPAIYELWHEQPFAFKHLRSTELATASVARWWPRGSSAKTVVVYPLDEADLKRHLEHLAPVVEGFAGADVLTSRRYAPGVFYRYGGIALPRVVDELGHQDWTLRGPRGEIWADDRTPVYRLPGWVSDPFAATPEATATRAAPLLHGRYEILSALRHSTAGGVYRAVDSQTASEVVVKEARPGTAIGDDGSDAVQRLEREASTLGQLAGLEGIPELEDVFEEGGHLFMVTRRIDAIPLQVYIARTHPMAQGVVADSDLLSYREKVRSLMENLGLRLKALHAAGICHGDLSLMNILVNPESLDVYLTDFEASRPLDAPHEPFPRTLGFSPEAGTPAWRDGETFDDFSLQAVEWACVFPRNALMALHPPTFVRQLRESARAIEWALVDVAERFAAGVRMCTTREEVQPGVVEGLVRGIVENASLNRPDQLFPADPELFRTNPLSIKHGAAGVLRAVHAVGGEVPANVSERFQEMLREASPTPVGLWTGWSGVAVTCLELGQVDLGVTILLGLPEARRFTNPHLAAGAAGVGLAMLRAEEMTGVKVFSERAVQLAHRARLLMAERREEHSIGDRSIGYGYGASGVAVFLAAIARRTGEDEWLRAASDCLDDDLAQAVDRPNGGLGFPTTRGRRALEPYLSRGGAGVGYALAVLAHMTPTPDLLGTLRRVLDGVCIGYTTNPGLLEGAAGGLALLKRAEGLMPIDHYLCPIVASIKSLLLPVGSTEILCPGNGLVKCSADYATGSAGLLELLAWAHRPSISGSAERRWETELWPTE